MLTANSAMSCQYRAKTAFKGVQEILGLFDIERTAGALQRARCRLDLPPFADDRWIVAIDSAREQFQIARGRRDSGQ